MKLNIAAISKRIAAAGTAAMPKNSRKCDRNSLWIRSSLSLIHISSLQSARVLIVCAGMEGALPTVVAGMVNAPVLAVPTSVGYGASFGGVAALLGMLNTCSPNVSRCV